MSTERVTITATFFGQTIQNVIHCNNPDGALTGPQVAAEFRDNWINNVRTQQCQSLVYRSVLVQRLPALANVPYTLGVSIAGVFGDDPMHPCLCMIFRLHTQRAGKHGRGRLYIAGNRGTGTVGAAGLVNAGNLAVWVALAATLEARFKSGGSGPLTIGVWDKSAGGTLSLIDGITCPNRVGIQRRRNIGVGI